MNISAYVTSNIRTIVPLIVAWLISLPVVPAVLSGLGVSNDKLATGVSLVLAAAYYAIVRWAEQKWPKLGVLLGVPAAPSYPTLAATSAPHVAEHSTDAPVPPAAPVVPPTA